MNNDESDWDLPCELHEIEPGIIFRLTSRNGVHTDSTNIDTYPEARFNASYQNHDNNNQSRDKSVSIGNSIDQNRNSISEQTSNSNNNSEDMKVEVAMDNESDKNEKRENIALPINTQPIYINPKQYYRILRRREIRTQLRNRLIRQNKVQTLYKMNGNTFKHKSRHKHAKKRPRGPRGQFLKKSK